MINNDENLYDENLYDENFEILSGEDLKLYGQRKPTMTIKTYKIVEVIEEGL